MIKGLPDDELLKRIQLNDQQAFAAIVQRYHVQLYRIIYSRVRQEDDASDILQEIFISLWSNRHQIELATALYPYLSKAAFYAVIDWQLQHKKNLARHHLLLEQDEPWIFSIETQLMADELQSELLEVVDKMPDTTKKVFQMSRVDHKSVKEIASTLQLSEQTVKNNISIALKLLRKQVLSEKLILAVLAMLIGKIR